LPDFPSLDKMHAYCRGEWIPHDEDCFGTQSEAYKAMGDSVAICGYLGGIVGYSLSLSNRGWCVEGGCEYPSSSSDASSSSLQASSSSQESFDVCKYNNRSGDAVYTAADCFNDGLDNMKPGKCYSLNPDRGTQYGWISYDVRDSWWWREVPCGESESDGVEVEALGTCSGVGFLQKKSFDGNSYNTYESDSYEIWGNKTKFFYDALGRKTQAHPEVRRYLFLPKKAYNKEQYSGFSEKTFMSEQYIEGSVSVSHKYGINWCTNPPKNTKCFSSTPLMGDLTISLSFMTIIDTTKDENNPLLKIHEDKHVAIYNSLGNKNWMESIRINLCENKTKEELAAKHCPEMRRIAKSKFEKQLTILINAQNKWDDDDKNNASHARINLQERIDYMRRKIETFNCLE